MKYLVYLLFAALIPVTAISQVSFEKSYYGFFGSTETYGTCVSQTSDLGYAICSPIHTGNLTSFMMIKTNPYGDTIMTKHFDGYGVYFIPATGGGFMITGGKNNRLLLLKTNSSFETEWTRTLGAHSLRGEAVCQAADSGYCFIATHSDGYNIGKGFDVVRTGKNGDSLWTTSFTGWNRDFDVKSVILAQDDGFVICGTFRPFFMGNASVFLLKLNSSGDSVWMKSYHRSNASLGYVVMPAGNNGYLVAAADHSLFLIRTNDQGDTIWTRAYQSIYNCGSMAATKVRTGGYLVAGSKIDSTLATDVCLVRLNENGDTLWTRSLGTLGNELSMSVRQTEDDGFIVSGTVGLNYPSQESAVYLVKTDSSGHYSPYHVDEILRQGKAWIHPNPFTNILKVRFPGQINSLELITIQGVTLYSASHPTSIAMEYALDLAGQPAGIYFLRIITEGTIMTQKVIKSN